MIRLDYLPILGRAADIRIVGLNKVKTRKTVGSYTEYQVSFELSATPPLMWKDIFGREWKDLTPLQDATIDGGFLEMRCPLQEVPGIHLPMLKRGVAATNEAYARYVKEQTLEAERPNEGWMPASWIPQTSPVHGAEEERKAVDDLAGSLVFE